MFGQNRRRRFEKAVAEEIAYLMDLHGEPEKAAEAALERAGRPHIPASRARVNQEAASRLSAWAHRRDRRLRPSDQTILASDLPQ